MENDDGSSDGDVGESVEDMAQERLHFFFPSSSSHASVVSAAGTLLICKFAAVTQARRAHKGRDED